MCCGNSLTPQQRQSLTTVGSDSASRPKIRGFRPKNLKPKVLVVEPTEEPKTESTSNES